MKFKKHCALAYKPLSHSELFWLQVIDNSNQLKQNERMCPNKGLSQAPKEKVQLCLKKGLAWRRRASRPLEAPPPPLSRLLGSPSGLCFALHISIFSWSRAIFSSTLMFVAVVHHPPSSPHIHIDRYTHVDTHTLTAPEFINLQVGDLQSLEKHP